MQDRATTPDDPEDQGGLVPGTRIGHYVIDASLGHGGTADVFVVRDDDGGRWALKLMGAVSQDDDRIRSRFRREFRALSRLDHPNVLAVEHWGVFHGRPWFTMELVEGSTLRDAMPTWRDASPEERFVFAHGVLVQAARALSYVHERGLVHRDVSPGNLLVADDGTVKLGDFGLVTDRSADLTTQGEILGTVAHMAPEQLRGGRVDARADLYALGTVLYQLLTGRRPFEAHTVQGWVDKHLRSQVRPPREVEPLVPELLSQVCVRLLQKDPADRFASALHLLRMLGDPSPEGAQGGWPPRAIGRAGTRSWIDHTLDEIATGDRGGALLLTGASGSGKTRLLDLAARMARERGLTVAHTRCRRSGRPFGPFVPIFEQLDVADPDDVLVRTFGKAPADGDDRYPVLAAFRDHLLRAAPAVVIVDQLDQADAATRQLVEYLIRNLLGLADAPVVFLITWESDDPDVRPLGRLEPLDHDHLHPLTRAEVEELVLSVLDDAETAAALAQRLHAETSGAPAQVADVLQAMVDEGTLVVEDGHGHLAADLDLAEGELPLPARLRAVLQDRIAPLDDDARAFGRTVALARSPLPLDLVIDACGLDDDAAMDALDDLVDAGVVVEQHRSDEERVELAHARFRDVLLADTPGAERAAGHRRVAELLEAHHAWAPAREAVTLAWHWSQAGVPDKAYDHLVAHAVKLVEKGLFEDGLAAAERAAALETEALGRVPVGQRDHRRARLALARARALYHLGRWDEALTFAVVSVTWADAAGDAGLCALTRTRLGYILRNRGLADEAEIRLREALRHAEAAGDRSLLPRPLYHLGAVRFRAGDVDEARTCWTMALELARETQHRRAEGMAYNGLGILAIQMGDAGEARRHLEIAVDLFRETGMVEYLPIVRSNLIEIYLAQGMLRKALQLDERTLAQARELANKLGIALGLVWRSSLLLALGRHDEARRAAEEARSLADELRTPDEQVNARLAHAQALLEMGRYDEAAEDAAWLADALARGDADDVAGFAGAVRARVLATLGETELTHRVLATVDVTRAPPHVQVRTVLEVARVHEILGDPATARSQYEAAHDRAQTHGFRAYQLLAFRGLGRTRDDAAAAGEARRRARGLARSLSASLPRSEADCLLTWGWGAVEDDPAPS